jgi:hypothetical protein
MATTTAYAVLNGSSLIESVVNDVGDDLLKLSDLAPDLFVADAPGTRRVALYLTGFVGGDDITVNVKVKLPEPIVIDAQGVAKPPFNHVTPFWTLAPANEQHSYYTTLQPTVYGQFLDPAVGPGVTLIEQVITIECAALSGGSPVGMMLGIDFFYSGSR